MNKKNVLIFISHYLPGFKMGGPINSIFQITDKLKGQYNFYVITSDRDMGDNEPYENIKQKEWRREGACKVLYLTPDLFYYINVVNHLRKRNYDIIYVNSFFSFKFSIFIVLINYFRLAQLKKIIITPRGELFYEALAFGKVKKKIFINSSKILNLYKNITWHSTGDLESRVIHKYFPKASIELARVISDNCSEIIEICEPEFAFKNCNFLKLVFISRISKDKNLIYAIKLLSNLSFNVEFHIYGPVEDENIWRACLNEIEKLPENIKISYRGILERKYVKSYFAQYHLFFFPTYRENFGHVVSESLSVGTPVLISDNTPWRNLSKRNLGWDINLRNHNEFIRVLNEFYRRKGAEEFDFRSDVKKSYREFIDYDAVLDENNRLFK